MIKYYIKIKIQDVLDGLVSIFVDSELAEILQRQGYNIKEGDDIGTKLMYYDRGEYRFLLLQARDLKNKGRKKIATEEEEQELLDYCERKGFEIVTVLPKVEMP